MIINLENANAMKNVETCDSTAYSLLYDIGSAMALIHDGDYSVWETLKNFCRKLYSYVSSREANGDDGYLNTHVDSVFLPQTDGYVYVPLPLPEIHCGKIPEVQKPESSTNKQESPTPDADEVREYVAAVVNIGKGLNRAKDEHDLAWAVDMRREIDWKLEEAKRNGVTLEVEYDANGRFVNVRE